MKQPIPCTEFTRNTLFHFSILALSMADTVPRVSDVSFSYRPKVLVTNKEIPSAGIELLRKQCEVVLPESVPPTREEILSLAKGVEGILWAGHSPINVEALDAAGPQLKAISAMSAGIDYVDVAEVRRRNISIGYTPRVLDNAVADTAIGLMIAASRRFVEGRNKIER